MFSLIQVLFRSVLFNVQKLKDFAVLFLLLTSSLISLSSEDIICMISILLNLSRWSLWTECDLFWWKFHESLRRIWILLLWTEYSINVNYINLLIVLLRSTLLLLIYQLLYKKRDVEVSNHNNEFIYLSVQYNLFLSHMSWHCC